jgi:membrane associated rhomboid family serine protease
MEPAPSAEESHGIASYLRSPTIIITITLIAMYILVSTAVGDFAYPITTGGVNGNLLVLTLTQCDTPTPIFPWTILTTIFLHANVIHLVSNLFFLVFFGFILEEQVSKSQWLMTFFVTGLVGSFGFVVYDFAGNILTGFPNPLYPDCAVGASGAVYGLMATAVGLRVVILMIFLLGLNIFAGGGTPAHLGGLVAGLLLRNYWSLGNRPFKGI